MSHSSEYLAKLANLFADPANGEYTYRSPMEDLLNEVFPEADGFEVRHEQSTGDKNKPDFVVRRKGGVPLLYLEVKAPGTDLNKIEKTDQAARYFGYTNLVISDYATFRFYRNGERYDEPIVLAELHTTNRTLEPHAEQTERLTRTLRDFVANQKEPIKSGKHLAKIMGGKAQRIRDNVIAFLASESDQKDELERMRRFIQDHLIAEFKTEDFADMYAQTLVYGLFAARYNDDSLENFSRQEAQDLVPVTNPFLRHFFGHIAGTSFPKRLEIIVDELCEVFSHANVRELMEQYFKQMTLDGGAHEAPDPVIHFYEDFLREYNPKKKMEMGVFYTPLPVVRFIVRGIDDLLKREFGIADGLADTDTIEQTVTGTDHRGRTVKDKVRVHRVQLLDVAVGTGTFLNETIRHIHHAKAGQQGRWNAYVNDHLLPRLHGFELMMASYTIAHLKLAMTLQQTGVENFEKRLGVYLSNTLDDAHDVPTMDSLFGAVASIAEESKKAAEVKQEKPIMVVLGNPPYSVNSQNKRYCGNEVYKVEPSGGKLKEDKNFLDDDYVKFIRFAESMIEKNGEGVIGMITNHGYIDNLSFRGMRWHLRKTFDAIYVLDLHGNSTKKETSPDGSEDKNVFDIKTGVSIIFGVKKKTVAKAKPLATIYRADLYGKRDEKFAALDSAHTLEQINWTKLHEGTEVWQQEGEGKDEYKRGFSIAKLFPQSSTGVFTLGDGFIVSNRKESLKERLDDFLNNDYLESELKDKFWDVLINLVDGVSILTNNSELFLSFSCTVAVYGTSTREISLLQRFGATFWPAEKTMYSLQAHLEN